MSWLGTGGARSLPFECTDFRGLVVVERQRSETRSRNEGNHMKKLIATVVLIASLGGVSVLASAPPASVGAFGCSGFRTINSPWGSGAVNQLPVG